MKVAMLTDPALWSWRRDVDDVLAIIMAKNIVGKIATTEGNANALTTYKTALYLKKKLGLKASIHPSPALTRLPSSYNVEDSTQALKQAIKESLDIISIAPNTYLSNSLREVKPKGQSLVVMGGYIKKRMLGFLPEFNFWKDPSAAKEVIMLNEWKRIIIIPVDTTISAKVPCKYLLNIINRHKYYEWLVNGILPWCRTSTILFRGFIPHDLVATLAYKCLILEERKCTGLDVIERKILLRKDRIIESSNGVQVELVTPSPKLSDLVLEDLDYSL